MSLRGLVQRGRRTCWWSFKGLKMILQPPNWEQQRLEIRGPAAFVDIRPSHHETGWIVSWSVNQGPTHFDAGSRWFSSADLQSAFGLSDRTPDPSDLALTKRFGATCLQRDQFIRDSDRLCLPGPTGPRDTGYSRWISLEVDPEVRAAVGRLLDLNPLGGTRAAPSCTRCQRTTSRSSRQPCGHPASSESWPSGRPQPTSSSRTPPPATLPTA